MDARHGDFIISNDPAKLDMDVVHGFLRGSYWAEGIPRALVEKAIRNSLCFGLYETHKQIGFARVVSDYATFAYLADVFVVEEYRGRGLAQWMMACILGHSELQGLRRWLLATKDAHGLYAKCGFTPLATPQVLMEIHRPTVYRR